VYGGQFMGCMYAEAFFESDPVRIVEAGLKCIPEKSQYAEMVRDMLKWYREDPNDWQGAWQKAQKKYREDPQYQKASNGGIDVKINGAYVLMGLLFGNRDLDKTIIISCRSGQDSDCNPSSSAGVLFTTIGFSKLPDRFTKKLDETKIFSHTAYNFPGLLDVCEKLARQALAQAGGRVEKDAQGEEFLVIPVQTPKPSPLELSWEPGPIAGSMFTESEMAKITELGVKRAFEKFAPGWRIRDCGQDMNPGLHDEVRGKKNVLVSHPLNKKTGCTLSRTIEVAADKKTTLRLVVGHHPEGDWTLIVKADGDNLLEKSIGKETSTNTWVAVEVDLSKYAGKTVNLELVNQPSEWAHEGAYWAELALSSQ
ncbi:MAG: hypothetical protein GX616_12270, partial [Planctomycetes bacterium]|nr:hypothetical protein [Planctomycetota bacterium]